MFNIGKKKAVFTHTQIRLLRVSLTLFRNNLIKENKKPEQPLFLRKD